MDNLDLKKIVEQCEKNAIPDNEIDYSDIPAQTDEELAMFRPVNPEYFKPRREQVSIRMNKVLVDHFRAMGKGWQTKINDFLMGVFVAGQI